MISNPALRMSTGSDDSTASGQHPSVLSPLLSPRAPSATQLPSTPAWQQPTTGHAHAGAPSRPSTMRGRSYTRPTMSHIDPYRPTTAPSAHHDVLPPGPKRAVSPSDRSTYTLPPISSITLRDPEEPSAPSTRMTLPAMHDRPPTRDTHSSSSSHVIAHDYYPFGRPTSSSSTGPWYASSMTHKDSVSSAASEVLTPMRESGPPFDRPLTGTGTDRPMTGYGSDRPPSSGYDLGPGRHHLFDSGGGAGNDKHSTPYHHSWDRPTTAGGHVSFEPHSRDRADPRALYLSPARQPHHRLSNASSAVAPPNYSRVLVGSLCSVCQRLQDEDGKTGLFFFAHDLGIRTEGTFTLKFTLTDLSS